MDAECPARKHTPTHRSYRSGCRCPETVARCQQLRRKYDAKYHATHGRPRPRRQAGAIDEVAVDRAVSGWPIRLTVPERGLAVARLTRAGLSAAAIGKRVGVSRRQVVRYRSGLIKRAADGSLARETSRETEAA